MATHTLLSQEHDHYINKQPPNTSSLSGPKQTPFSPLFSLSHHQQCSSGCHDPLITRQNLHAKRMQRGVSRCLSAEVVSVDALYDCITMHNCMSHAYARVLLQYDEALCPQPVLPMYRCTPVFPHISIPIIISPLQYFCCSNAIRSL